MTEVQTVYVTFGQKYATEEHPTMPEAHPDGWLEIRGVPFSEGVRVAFALTGGFHAFSYEHRPDERMYSRGAIKIVDLRGLEVPENEVVIRRLVKRLEGVESPSSEQGRVTEFSIYQDAAEITAIYPKDRAMEYLGLGLVSEAGEVAGKIKKIIRDTGGEWGAETQADMAGEIGDVLWYLAMLASLFDLDLSDVALANLDKLYDRKQRGVLGGSGDNR